MSRPTIAEIARRAGVSKSAVSYALNGLPGVSDDTRARIVAVAKELDWRPHAAARALAGAKVGTLGMVLNRPASLLGVEPFYMEFISGIQEVLSDRDMSLLLKVAGSVEDELAAYRSWSASAKVDGVIVTDLAGDDPRPAALRDMGMTAVLAGEPVDADTVALWTDDAVAVQRAVDHLVSLGHRRLGHVTGIPRFVHTQTRARAFDEAVRAANLPPPMVVATDFTQEQGARVTRAMLTANERPTAILYDNDLMAAGAVAVATQMRIKVPRDLSVVAWDDSVLSRSVYPPLTSISVDVQGYGIEVVQALLALIDGQLVESRAVGEVSLRVRGSTSAPR